MENSNEEKIKAWHNDSNHWKFGMFYYNQKDKRILIDKPNPNYGITLNFANAKSYLVLLMASVFLDLLHL